jgi:hypothetical protein
VRFAVDLARDLVDADLRDFVFVRDLLSHAQRTRRKRRGIRPPPYAPAHGSGVKSGHSPARRSRSPKTFG